MHFALMNQRSLDGISRRRPLLHLAANTGDPLQGNRGSRCYFPYFGKFRCHPLLVLAGFLPGNDSSLIMFCVLKVICKMNQCADSLVANAGLTWVSIGKCQKSVDPLPLQG
jgi:hypothetical protein